MITGDGYSSKEEVASSAYIRLCCHTDVLA